jgi:hypothetical protein
LDLEGAAEFTGFGFVTRTAGPQDRNFILGAFCRGLMVAFLAQHMSTLGSCCHNNSDSALGDLPPGYVACFGFTAFQNAQKVKSKE